MTLKEKLEESISSKYTKAEEEKSQAFYSFLRQVLISSTTLLGILISFYDKNSNNYSHVFFSISVVSCVIGILCLSYLLFSEVEIQKSFQRASLKEQRLLMQENYVVKEKYEWKGEYPKIARPLEYISVFSFVLFLISLVIYVIIN